MMPQSNFLYDQTLEHDHCVISLYYEIDGVTDGILDLIDHVGKIYRYKLCASDQVLRHHFPGALHYLDHFWILLPSLLKDQRLLWDEFYKIYSSIYEELINQSHNIQCLQRFKQLLEDNFGFYPGCSILDFGCGTGLSSRVFETESLTGYDSNELMRHKAQEQGLKTVDKENFEMLPIDIFDSCIACYVFHLAIESSYIKKISRVVKNGGVIVANYYKGINEKGMNALFLKNGLAIQQIEDQRGRFGSIYVYRK